MRHRYAIVLIAGIAAGLHLYLAADGDTQDLGTPLPRTAAAPADNPTTPAKVALGRQLFWDPLLSGTKDVACATCHHPEFGYAENRDLSIGVTGSGLGHRREQARGSQIPFVKRNSQTILNVAFNGADETGRYDPSSAPMFWDVRARSLERQSLEPLKALEEMRGTAYSEEDAVNTVVARLRAVSEYREAFARAFAGGEVSAENLAKALAAFQRTIVANNAPLDRYLRGEEGAMSASQLRGMRRFERIGCVNCHNGPMFSDYKLHVLGVPDNPALPVSDAGAEGTYAFRTASLRNLRFTAPFMHTGRLATLRDVLEFYDDVDSGGGRRGRINRDRNVNVSREQLDPLLRRLRGVDDDDEDLLAFLEDALSDDTFDRTIPDRVPSGLPVGGAIR